MRAGNVGAAGEDLAVRGQKRGRRPTAEVVTLADIGPSSASTRIGMKRSLISAAIDRIGVAGAVHLVTSAHHAAEIESSTGLRSAWARANAARSTGATRQRSKGL